MSDQEFFNNDFHGFNDSTIFKKCSRCGGEILIRTNKCISYCAEEEEGRREESTWARYNSQKAKICPDDIEIVRARFDKMSIARTIVKWGEYDIEELYDELGTFRAVAIEIGVHPSTLMRHLRHKREKKRGALNRF